MKMVGHQTIGVSINNWVDIFAVSFEKVDIVFLRTKQAVATNCMIVDVVIPFRFKYFKVVVHIGGVCF